MYDLLTSSLHDDIPDDIVLSYLNCKPSERLMKDIDRLKKILVENMKPGFITAEFQLKKKSDEIHVLSTNLILTGNSIRDLLVNSEKCILLAATLGIETDRLINLMQKTSISDGVIADAIANTAIEVVCDNIQNRLSTKHSLTMRYSPGYGDFPLEIQGKILTVLNTQKTIGLYCNQSNLLLPLKSVTAVLGIAGSEFNPCRDCRLLQGCNLRKAGKRCGYQRVR